MRKSRLAINKLGLSGNVHYLIKQISGHKTDIAFQRYNLVTEEEIHQLTNWTGI